jgi:hypothetical protein
MKLFCNFPGSPSGTYGGRGCGTMFQTTGDDTPDSQQTLRNRVAEHVRINHSANGPHSELFRKLRKVLDAVRPHHLATASADQVHEFQDAHNQVKLLSPNEGETSTAPSHVSPSLLEFLGQGFQDNADLTERFTRAKE